MVPRLVMNVTTRWRRRSKAPLPPVENTRAYAFLYAVMSAWTSCCPLDSRASAITYRHAMLAAVQSTLDRRRGIASIGSVWLYAEVAGNAFRFTMALGDDGRAPDRRQPEFLHRAP